MKMKINKRLKCTIDQNCLVRRMIVSVGLVRRDQTITQHIKLQYAITR